MKKLVAPFLIAALISAPVFASENHEHGTSMKKGDMHTGMMGTMNHEHMVKMHEHMDEMRELMEEIKHEKAPKKRHQLMEKHMQSMQEGMHMMEHMSMKKDWEHSGQHQHE